MPKLPSYRKQIDLQYWFANQLTAFYMMATLVFKELRPYEISLIEPTFM